MKPIGAFICLFLSVLTLLFPAWAADKSVEDLLPQSCGPDWIIEGAPAGYIPETLYKYINGEAELYLPYGFEIAATVLYIKPPDKDKGMVVNVFTMGSHLDAFGIYGNYRSPASVWVKVGDEAFSEDTGLNFYQDRYFVQIMASGTLSQNASTLLTCATSISKILPARSGQPKELSILDVPGLVPHSEKYFPDGLLGYKFLGRGMTAEVMLKGAPVKALVVMGKSPADITKALRTYYRQLLEEKGTTPLLENAGSLRLSAKDPLYKGMIMEQAGHYAVGVTGLTDAREGLELVKELIKRLPK